MISRLTLSAVLFAVLATATLSFAAESQHAQRPEMARSAAVAADPVVVMPRVEVIGRRPH
jgi:metal-dependent amidase/aminoacylase/carboxypeptidase family protein